MKSTIATRFINFLQDELALPSDSINLALRHREQSPSLLPMILWQYGLISLEQMDRIFDWLENSYVTG
ncbi:MULTISPECIES: DUF2949 domain-containing protein [Spirulina sp. CCY15215]|uniref:DUF2949 domain-containing protein n=1 Tax=Spirulina sp. CCY15215 TaxID=2767591 RepID=UPI00194EFBDB|nr:DUF2949 domain-containing protein [Spirulina major]